ncbi:MAG: crotonase/enoyl-CoA hydratase family protein [Actinomycetota bacterium]
MGSLVGYALADGIATITLDDGKANALSPNMQAEINDALDQAMKDEAAVVLTGRDGMFSAGFDLKVLGSGGMDAIGMVKGGFLLAERLLSNPKPVVIACTGHAIAMGVFLLLCGDYRVGGTGAYRIIANEVAIGLTMPLPAIEICRQRLNPAHFSRAIINAELFSADNAVEAGFLDRVVAPEDVAGTARDKAVELLQLDQNAHTQTKLKARSEPLKALRSAIEAEFGA